MIKVFMHGYKGSPKRVEILYNHLLEKENFLPLPTFKFDMEEGTYRKESYYKIILRFFNSDVIYLGPMSHRILMIIICKIFHKKVICDIYAGLYDSTVNDRKIYTKNHLKARIHWLRDRLAMKYSDTCLFLNKSEKKHFIESVGLQENEVNAKCVPLAIEDKIKSNLNYYQNSKTHMDICWTGTFIPLQGLDKIINAMKILDEKKMEFKLHIYGPDNANANIYKELVKELKLEKRIEFVDLWGDMMKWKAEIFEKCDLNLGIFGDSDKAKVVVANKVIDGITFGTPVLTGYSYGIDEYFDGVNDIYTVDNKPYEIANKIIEISQFNYEKIRLNCIKAYQIYSNNFTPSIFKDSLESIIEEVYKNGNK